MVKVTMKVTILVHRSLKLRDFILLILKLRVQTPQIHPVVTLK